MHKLCLAVVAAVMLTAACVPLPTPPVPGEQRPPTDFPQASYLQAAERGRTVFRIEPERSLVIILVYRSGPLTRLGHDHVIASRDITGYAELEAGRADLYVPLERLVVDDHALRVEAGFNTQPTDDDIAGTRHNMLEKVLETGRFPFALIHVGSLETDANGTKLNVEISLHGVTHALQIPAKIDTGTGELDVSGSLSLNQTDFGITPFSVLGGLIQVQDRVDFRFRIRARPVGRGDILHSR
jgi:polyisoprenoid-binding protein YceI